MGFTRAATRHDVRSTSDGSTVELRALQPDEESVLLEVFDGMSAGSREQRFLTPKPRLLASEMRRLMDVDHHDHVALVAWSVTGKDWARPRPVAIARFVRTHDAAGSAEVAVSVIDEWQRRGVGTLLVSALTQRAIEVGVDRFVATIGSSNAAARKLVRKSGLDVDLVSRDRGTTQYAAAVRETAGGPVGLRSRR